MWWALIDPLSMDLGSGRSLMMSSHSWSAVGAQTTRLGLLGSTSQGVVTNWTLSRPMWRNWLANPASLAMLFKPGSTASDLVAASRNLVRWNRLASVLALTAACAIEAMNAC